MLLKGFVEQQDLLSGFYCELCQEVRPGEALVASHRMGKTKHGDPSAVSLGRRSVCACTCAHVCMFSRTHARCHRSTSDHVSLWRLLQPLIPVTSKLWLRKPPSPALPHAANGLLLPPKASWDPPFGEYRSGLLPEALPPQGRPPRALGVGLLWGSGLQHSILPRVRLRALPAAWA